MEDLSWKIGLAKSLIDVKPLNNEYCLIKPFTKQGDV
jgi:hypothetical protein